VTSGTLNIGPTTTFAAAYDATGNITSKTDTAGTRSYSYPAPVEGTFNHPHGVTSSGGSSYSYDTNGNMTSRAGGAVVFNVANLPTSITSGGYTSTFTYGAARNRYKQVAGYSGRTETTWYVGSLYERMTKTGSSTTEYRYQVTAGGLPVARVTQYSTGTVRTQFMHRDHLGSIDTITDETGTVVARMSFDAHGTRRVASGTGAWNTLLGYSSSVALLDGLRDKTTRGFTDHEMLDNVGLIHMNGRVYDPTIGRFLSVDPVFQFPENTQSLNPYTYVLNTPLTLTDPTGMVSEGFSEERRAAVVIGLLWRKTRSPAAMFAQYLKEMEADSSTIGDASDVKADLEASMSIKGTAEKKGFKVVYVPPAAKSGGADVAKTPSPKEPPQATGGRFNDPALEDTTLMEGADEEWKQDQLNHQANERKKAMDEAKAQGSDIYMEYSQGANTFTIYDSTTGQMIERTENAYSGKGADKDNPSSEKLKFRGPIPRGLWLVTDDVNDSKGPMTIVLKPVAANNNAKWHDRDAFLIHGDSINNPGNASEGCIVLPPGMRQQIINHNGGLLRVTE
jgi:RHS repeat-associated protein